jgi:phosphate starvation-inducible PhoH-like protein|tara:strand:- start:23453 stop:24130 length:678 start_codon:yes stop_codon:yes gene_type:complete
MAKKTKNDIKKFNDHLTLEQLEAKKEMYGLDVATFNGLAGTGKSSLAVNYAYEQLCLKEVDKIIITRATAMRKQHDLGFMKGDLNEKMESWMVPIYDAIRKLEPPTADSDKVEELMATKKLEIVPLAYIQGRTFENAIIIVDEYQNLDSLDIQMVITRLGRESKMIFSGDFRQSLIYNSGITTLNKACDKFDRMKNFTFTENFRSPIVEKIIGFYESEEEKNNEK